jgi:signal transduction histidine kinase
LKNSLDKIKTTQQKSSGIARQLLRVFLLQMLFISAITLAGVYVAAKVVEGVMMRAALEGEASHFWSLLESNPEQHLPNTDNLIGYLSRGDNHSAVPSELLSMSQGYGRTMLNGSEPLVYVQRKNNDTLYLVFDEASVSRLSFYFGVVPLSLALIILYISAWFAYRQSRKAVSPLVQLARTMREFNIESHNLDDLDLPEAGASPGNNEVEVLISALNGFTDEIRQLIARERSFTRDASHELRTPLTVIQGSAEWLATNSTLDQSQRSAVDRILRTVGDMSELVNALLLLARGLKQGVRKQQVDVVSVVREIISELELTHNRDSRVTVSLKSDGPVLLECSPEGLSMVLSNLLRNAYSYTDEGEVLVEIFGCSVEISNPTEGISDADLQSLFKPFVRGEKSLTKSGHGVGLDIVKRLCDHFNWTVEAKYLPQKGMCFNVSFEDSVSELTNTG